MAETERKVVAVGAVRNGGRIGPSPGRGELERRKQIGPELADPGTGRGRLRARGGQVGTSLERRSHERVYTVGERGHRPGGRARVHIVGKIGRKSERQGQRAASGLHGPLGGMEVELRLARRGAGLQHVRDRGEANPPPFLRRLRDWLPPPRAMVRCAPRSARLAMYWKYPT